MKIMTFSQHEKREQTIVYASNMSIEGVQKPTKIGSKKLEKYRKTTWNKKHKKAAKCRFSEPVLAGNGKRAKIGNASKNGRASP